MLKSVLTVYAILLVAACASTGNRTRCVPVPAEFQSAGVVYTECEVNVKAEIAQDARPEMPGRPEGTSSCYNAYFDFVVDTSGKVISRSAKLIRTNNTMFAEGVKSRLDQVRYRPAEKSGQRVQQLVHYKSAIAMMVTVVRAGQAPTSPRASGNVPRC